MGLTIFSLIGGFPFLLGPLERSTLCLYLSTILLTNLLLSYQTPSVINKILYSLGVYNM